MYKEYFSCYTSNRSHWLFNQHWFEIPVSHPWWAHFIRRHIKYPFFFFFLFVSMNLLMVRFINIRFDDTVNRYKLAIYERIWRFIRNGEGTVSIEIRWLCKWCEPAQPWFMSSPILTPEDRDCRVHRHLHRE